MKLPGRGMSAVWKRTAIRVVCSPGTGTKGKARPTATTKAKVASGNPICRSKR